MVTKPRFDMRFMNEVKGSGVGRDWNCYACGEQGHFSRDCPVAKKDPKPARTSAVRQQGHDRNNRNHNNGGGKGKQPTVKAVAFNDKTDAEQSDKSEARPSRFNDHLTVPEGPGWEYSTTDNRGWNQDAFKAAIATAIKNKAGQSNVKRERADVEEPKNGRDGNTRTRRS
jgi:hypothetical protein